MTETDPEKKEGEKNVGGWWIVGRVFLLFGLPIPIVYFLKWLFKW